MSNNNYLGVNEHLSDLLDDCVNEGAIEQILTDSEQGETWYRYQAVRSVLNKEYSALSSLDFTHTISALIAKEPAIIARPGNSALEKDNIKLGNKTKPGKTATGRLFVNASVWKRSYSGIAIAASVAFVMVFSVQMVNFSNDSLNGETVAGFQESQDQEAVQISVSQSGDAEQAKLDEIQRIIDQRSRLNLSANEQLVGGQFMVQSFVVKTKDSLSAFEEEVRNMKKPSEIEQKDHQ